MGTDADKEAVRAGDDDSGTGFNASFAAKLYLGRRYVVRLRLYWAWASGQTVIMMTSAGRAG